MEDKVTLPISLYHAVWSLPMHLGTVENVCKERQESVEKGIITAEHTVTFFGCQILRAVKVVHIQTINDVQKKMCAFCVQQTKKIHSFEI